MDEATRNELLLLRDLGYTHLELAVGRWENDPHPFVPQGRL